TIPAPVLQLRATSFDDWFAGKSSNFRQQMRRGRRKLEEEGAVFRMSRDVDELARDLQAFAELHHSRWDERGGSRALSPAVEVMLLEAGRTMLSSGGFRLWSLEIAGRIVSSHLFLAAGGEVAYWLGGFDEQWAAQKPSMQVLLEAVRHAWASGDERVDLGGGGQDYKYRFTDQREMLEWSTIVPPGLRYQATRVSLSTVRVRRKLVSKLGPRAQARLRALVRR
ncbi:MAG: GNAT family N-acetyltransferase, partial [Actinomycetota bacterium]